MQAHTEDRIGRGRRRSLAPWILLILIGLAAGGGWYYQRQQPASEAATPPRTLIQPVAQAPAPPPPAPPAPVAPAATESPVTAADLAASEPPVVPMAEAPPLPPLDQSDDAIKAEVNGLIALALRDALELQWQGDNLLRRFVAFVANLAEGKLDSKSSPIAPPKGRFAVTKTEPLEMTVDSQARFNTLVNIITSIEPANAATAYRHYYPLLQAAYADLGEKKTFHTVMLSAIDKLLAAPEPKDNPLLVPAEKGLYAFADPALEALPAAQKPLLRMGISNERQLKAWLKQVRTAILQAPVAASPSAAQPESPATPASASPGN